MKSFLKKLFAYLFIVVTVLCIILSYCFYDYQKTRVPQIKYNTFHNNFKNADSIGIVLGTSHTFYGIDTKLLDGEVFNFASISQSLMEDYAILKHIKNPIKRVVLPLSYFSNWHYLYTTQSDGEKLRTIDYQSTYNINYPKYLKRKDIMNLLSEVSKNPFKKASEDQFDNKGNLIGKCDFDSKDITDAKTVFERHKMGKDFSKINPYLDSITRFCYNNNIKLFIVVTPYTQAYKNYTSAGGFDNYLNRIKIKYNINNCFVLDFRTYFKASDESTMFRDADHLSICGRSAFTKYLNQQINTISSTKNHTPQVSN